MCSLHNEWCGCGTFVDVIFYRKGQRRTNEEVTDMNVFANDAALNDVTSQYETLADRESVYDRPLDDMAGYDNPVIDDNVGYSDVNDLSAAVDNRQAYEPLHDDRPCYTSPSNDIIGHNNSQEPLADTMYLELLDDDDNTLEILPPRDNIDGHHDSLV